MIFLMNRCVLLFPLIFWGLLAQASSATQAAVATLQETNGEARQNSTLTPALAPTTGTSKYKTTLTLSDGPRVMNYSVTIDGYDGGWRVIGNWPPSNGNAGEVNDIAILEKGTLLLRRESFRRFPPRGQQGKPVTIDLEFTQNKVAGVTTSASGEIKPVTAELSAAIYPGGVAIDVVIGCLPLADGYAATYRYWDIQTLKEGALLVKVIGTERVTVAAGTFDSWKVELATADGSERGTVWIAKGSRTPLRSSGSKTVGGGTIYSSTDLVP